MSGTTARSLRSKTDRRVIDSILRDQCVTLDAAIESQHAAGFNSYLHELPTNFGINNMSKYDAQLMVYTELIRIYGTPEDEGGRGFTVGIKLGEGAARVATLHLQWQNGITDDERLEREAMLKQFIIRESTPARRKK